MRRSTLFFKSVYMIQKTDQDNISTSFYYHFPVLLTSIHLLAVHTCVMNNLSQSIKASKITEYFSGYFFQTANLLADIGGQIGLWAGLSVISMCELLELFALLFRDFFQRHR